MRLNYFLTSLLFYPLCAFSQTAPPIEPMIFIQETDTNNTIVRSLSSEGENERLNANERSIDHPTQIIRLSSTMENQTIDCATVNEEINKIFINKITRDKFTYSTHISCTYDPQTNYAIRFTLKSYFDPLDDEAIEYLKSYLSEYNGIDFLGTKFDIESAQALIISLNLSVGSKKNPNTPPFIEYREDRSNFYFKNNYEMRHQLITDINERFFSDDPNKILPFLDKWLFNYAGTIYKAVLRDSNYVQLQPERIFLMSTGEELFVSPIKYYFAHNCTKYEHQHCLKQQL